MMSAKMYAPKHEEYIRSVLNFPAETPLSRETVTAHIRDSSTFTKMAYLAALGELYVREMEGKTVARASND